MPHHRGSAGGRRRQVAAMPKREDFGEWREPNLLMICELCDAWWVVTPGNPGQSRVVKAGLVLVSQCVVCSSVTDWSAGMAAGSTERKNHQ